MKTCLVCLKKHDSGDLLFCSQSCYDIYIGEDQREGEHVALN